MGASACLGFVASEVGLMRKQGAMFKPISLGVAPKSWGSFGSWAPNCSPSSFGRPRAFSTPVPGASASLLSGGWPGSKASPATAGGAWKVDDCPAGGMGGRAVQTCEWRG